MASCYESFYGRVMLCFLLVAALNLVSLIIIGKSFLACHGKYSDAVKL